MRNNRHLCSRIVPYFLSTPLRVCASIFEMFSDVLLQWLHFIPMMRLCISSIDTAYLFCYWLRSYSFMVCFQNFLCRRQCSLIFSHFLMLNKNLTSACRFDYSDTIATKILDADYFGRLNMRFIPAISIA